jgi:hypothetical protein
LFSSSGSASSIARFTSRSTAWAPGWAHTREHVLVKKRRDREIPDAIADHLGLEITPKRRPAPSKAVPRHDFCFSAQFFSRGMGAVSAPLPLVIWRPAWSVVGF